jgi:replicative DNA helicase
MKQVDAGLQALDAIAMNTVPHAIEAEQFVLGAMLIDNGSVDRLGDLQEEHFFNYEHRLIFRAIMKLAHSCKPADVLTVFDALQAQGKPVELTYLNALYSNTPGASNVFHYAGIVRDRAIKRELAACGKDLVAAAITASDACELVDTYTSRLEALVERGAGSEPKHACDTLVHFIEDLDERYQGNGIKPMSTGFAALDKKLNGGLRGGQLVVVAGRPKMGKTAFALNIANHIAQDYSVQVHSMEMPLSELHARNVASIGHIDLDHLTDPQHKMTDEDWPRLTHAVQKINRMDLYLDDKPALTLMDIRMKAKMTKRRYGLHLLVVDYLQLMSGEGDNRNAEIEAITRGLKALAKELDIAVMLLSQLNRELERRPNKRPIPSDLRDSGSIEQDADIVVFLYRDEVYNPDTMDRGVCEVDVALHRQGASGRLALAYLGEQVRFENLAHEWQERAQEPRRAIRKGGLL